MAGADWWKKFKREKGLSSDGDSEARQKSATPRAASSSTTGSSKRTNKRNDYSDLAKSKNWWETYKKQNNLDQILAAEDNYRKVHRETKRQLEENQRNDAIVDRAYSITTPRWFKDQQQGQAVERSVERYERDLPLYQQRIEAAAFRSDLYQRRLQEAQDAESAFKNQFQRYQQASQKAEADRNEKTLVNRPAQWQAENLSPQEIQRRLDYYRSEAATPTVADRDRNDPRYAYLYPDAAIQKDPHGARFDERLVEDAGQEAVDAAYRPILSEQEQEAVKQADQQILADKAQSNYEQVQILTAAQKLQGESYSRALGQQLIDEIAKGGEAANQAKTGKAMFDQQQARIAADTDVEIKDDLESSRGAYTASQKERQKRGYILGYDWDNVPEEQKQAVYALFTQSPQQAIELAKYYIADVRQAEDERRQAWYAQNALTAGVGLVSSAGAHLLAGIDPLGEFGQELTRRGDNALAGGSQWADAATGYQKIPEWVPIVGGKGAGDLYQTVGSVVQSTAIAAPAILAGRYDKAAAEVVSKLGLVLMGSSAAASDYRESVAAGMDDDRAKLHALAAGVEEALFEEVSLDKLVSMDTSGGFKALVRNWLVQSGVEGSEELATGIANRITDELISGAGQSKVERRTSELIANGMSATQAKQQAESEWLTDTLYEGFSGSLSGGMMTGGNYALQGVANLAGRAANTVETRKAQKQAGAAISSTEGSVEALQAYAKDKGIEIKAVETAAQNDEQNAGESTEQVNQDGKQSNYSSRDYRAISDTSSKVMQSIRSEVRGKTVQEQQTVRDSLVEKYGDGIAPVVNNAISVETAARVRQEYGSVDSIQAARNQAVSEIKDESLRRAVSDGYDSAAYSLAASQGGEGGMDTMSRYIQQRRNTGSGSEMSMKATVTAQDGSTKTIAITGLSEDGKRVSLADGSKVAVKDLQADEDTTSAIQQLADLDLGDDATKVLQAYQQSGVSGTDGYRWLMDYATAYNQGRTRQISLEQAAKRSSLDERTVMDAYTRGQQAANRETQAGLEKLKNLPKRKGANGRTANIDTTEIRGKTMSKSELEQFELANQYAQALGIDMKWFSSREKDGKFIDKNGAYENGKIYMDIHAGRNFAADLTSGILATMGHELTHFQQQYAPEEYQAIKEFLFEQIVKSSPNGEARLERLIWEKQKRSGYTLSRKAAEDEVVADACQKMLRDSKAVHDFASQQPEAANGVVRWLDKWFKKVRSIFGRGGNYSEEAQLMDSLEQDVKAAFGELWDKALKQAVQVHDEVGNIEKATTEGESKEESKAQSSDRDAEYLELAKDPEKNAARLQEMVDEAAERAGYDTGYLVWRGDSKPYNVLKTGAELDEENGDDYNDDHGNLGNGLYFTPDRSYAERFAGRGGVLRKFYLKSNMADLENADVRAIRAAIKQEIEDDFGDFSRDELYERLMEETGTDGIKAKGVGGFSGGVAREAIVRESWQAKLSDPVTYDDDGNVIPLSERFNEANEDIRYSERDELASDNQVHDLTNNSGDVVGIQNGNGHAVYSERTYENGGREAMESYLRKQVDEKRIDQTEMDQILASVDEIYKYSTETTDEHYRDWATAEVKRNIFGKPVYSWAKENAEYGKSLDASLICIKRRTLDAVFDYMIQNGMFDNFDLGQQSVVAINDIIRSHGFEIACGLCYIDAKRYRAAMVAGQFADLYNDLVKSMLPDGMAIEEIGYFNYGKNSADIYRTKGPGLANIPSEQLNFSKIDEVLKTHKPKSKRSSGDVEYRVAKALKSDPSMRKLVSTSDFMSKTGFENVGKENAALLKLYNAKKGTGGPKATEGDTQYLHEILASSSFDADKYFRVGGLRVQSFSDYIPRLVMDYAEMIGDMAAKKLPSHAYSKELMFALQFGLSGMKINMSLIPAMVDGGTAPGLDANGNYAWRDGQSFGSTVYGINKSQAEFLAKVLGEKVEKRLTAEQGFRLAKLIQSAEGYRDNCGTIAIGVSNEQIWKMLEDEDIRMVIPYHKSGLNHILASLMNVKGFTDYTAQQNTLRWNGEAWVKLAKSQKDFNFNEYMYTHKCDARTAARAYIQWCEKKGYKPKFSGYSAKSAEYDASADFTKSDNYYKVLEDFNSYDAVNGKALPQKAVQAVFPSDQSAFGSMKDLMAMAIDGEALQQARQDKTVPEIVKEIQKTLPALEQTMRETGNDEEKIRAYEEWRDRNGYGEQMQFSERDYSTPSDEELLINASVEDAESPEARTALQNSQKQARQIRDLTRRLERLQAEIRGYEGDSPNRISVQRFRQQALDLFGIPAGVRTDMGELLQSVAEGVLSGHNLSQNDIMYFFETLITNGREKTVADETLAEIRDDLKGRKIYVSENVKAEFGDDWNAFRKRAFSLGIQLTNSEKNMGIDSVNLELAELYPGKFDADETDLRSILENIVDTAESGKTSNVPILDAMRETQKQTGEPVREQLQTMLDQFTRQIEIMQDQAAVERKARAGNAAEIAKARKQINEAKEALREVRKQRDAWKRKSEGADARQKRALEAAMRNVIQHDAKQIAEAVRQKQALAKKLQDQIDHEKKILSGELRSPELVKMLKAEREKAEARVKEQKEQVFQNYKERKKASDLRGRIKNLSDEMKRRMTNPTDRAYVPASLYQSMTKLADVLDNVLSPNPGTKAEARYRAMMDAIRGMAREYEDVKNLDPVFASEYEQEVSDAIGEIERILERKNASWIDGLTGDTQKGLAELNSDELQQLYDLMRQINYTITNATKVFGNSNYKSILDAQRAVAEQQNSMKGLNMVSRLEQKKRLRLLNSLSVMRATEMMAGWDRSAALYQLMHGIEQGADDAWAWVMNYNKSMQDLKTGKNEKEYRQALTKQLDFGITDRDGLKVTMTKMQALQILMTAEREEHNDKLLHLQAGGAVIRNATDLQNGKGAKARSQTISVTLELIQKIRDSLTEWDSAYMKTVRDYFKQEGKRTNEILYKLKHKVLKTEEFYVPYTVDRNYLEANLNEQQALNMWVKTPGSTNALKQKAKQPVIIDGMDTVMGQHVKEIGNYIGMAIPIRDFSKVYNGMIPTDGPNPLPVKETIERTFGKAGQHLLTQAVIDVQGGTARQNWESNIAQFLNKLQGAFVRSALLINPSVTIKQAASYIAAESVISHLALERGNHPVWAKTDESKSFMPGGLIAQLFARPEGKTAQRIYNEIDQNTSLHYQRRQGMSMAEIAEQANRTGPIKRRINAIGASMEQSRIGHAVRRTGENLNPITWIQRMDVATTAALWVACKEQAKLDKLAVGSEEFWKRTTELYERCIRETQPMYDGLHRTANQKQAGGLMQYLFPFRTVPIQNHGQLAASYEAYKAALESKSKAKIKEAGKFFRKTAWAQTESAFVFSVMTFLAATLKRKTKKYRDEEGEFGTGSFAKGLLTDVGSTLISVLNPMYGSELFNLGSRAVDKFEGNSGYTYDAFSVGVVDMINDLASSGDRLLADAGKIVRGEDVNAADFWDHAMNLLVKGGKLAGIPADTAKTYFEGTKGNIQDAIEGRVPALNDESWERDAATNARRYLKAYLDNDTKKASAVLAELRSNLSKSGKSEAKINEAIRKSVSAQAVEKVADGTWTEKEAEAYLLSTGAYDDREDPQKDAWNVIRKGVAKSTSTDEEFKWNQYDDLSEAVANGEDVTGLLTEYRNHGYTETQINGALRDSIQEAMTSGELNEDEAADALINYGVTYSKDGQAVVYDKQSAWKKVQEWADKAEHTDEEGEIEDGYKYSAYSDLFEVVDANQDAEGVIKEMVQNGGYDADSLRGQIKEHLRERFIAGEITETALKNQLSRYCKIVNTKDVNEIVANTKCKRDFGACPDDLKEAFKDGDLSQNQAVKALQQYKGLSKTDAQNRVQYWGYDGDLSENAWLKWNKDLKGSGLSVENWEKVSKVKGDAKGIDANGDGRADSGTVKDEVVSYIDSMDIPKSQKKAIYLAFGWAASTMPNWH